MQWLLGSIALLIIGYFLRRILRLDEVPSMRAYSLQPLPGERKTVYEPISLELETQTAILGISLNDAIEEKQSNNHDIAFHLVHLSVCEWERLSDMVTVLLGSLAVHIPNARISFHVRTMTSERFKTRVMVDYIRMHELLEQTVFRSRVRFELHIRILTRALETLTTDFNRAYEVWQSSNSRDGFWAEIDAYFHDFDMITKETLLALRAFLLAMPESRLRGFAADTKKLLDRSVRSRAKAAGRNN